MLTPENTQAKPAHSIRMGKKNLLDPLFQGLKKGLGKAVIELYTTLR